MADSKHSNLQFKDQINRRTNDVPSGNDIEQDAPAVEPTIPFALAEFVPQPTETSGGTDTLGRRGPLGTITESENSIAGRTNKTTRMWLLVFLLGVAVLSLTVVATLFITESRSTPPTTLRAPQQSSSLPITSPTPSPTPSPTSFIEPTPCGGVCDDEGSICLETANTCCEECKRLTLTQVDTDNDGTDTFGGNVEATFFIQGTPLFGGEIELPSEARHVFQRQPNSVGNIRPDESVDLRVYERDGGTFVDPDDDARFTLPPVSWYDPRQTPYQRETSFGGWRLFYTIEAECCV